ncbi:hypothetical protein ACDW82_01545 [Alcaligenes faecalis]|uniref:hypothetical protein n=1 Tax=Alcaligenes faecalis TaxID=511 RepID=UPI0018EED32D|nr:hypothetical protein [Alcaligenes faecalis]
MSYELKELSEETLNLTEEAWSKLTEPDVFALELKSHFEWAKQHIDYTNSSKSSFAYGIFKADEGEQARGAEALIEIIQSPTGRRVTKLLKLVTSAKYWDVSDASTIGDLHDVLHTAITGTIELSSHNSSRVLKFYGRNAHLLNILISINRSLNDAIKQPNNPLHGKLNSKMVDRWLEISIS